MAGSNTTKAKNVRMALTAGFLSLCVAGCDFIENLGGTDDSTGTPVTGPADFEVINENPPTPPPTTGGDNTTQPSDPSAIEEGFLVNGGQTKTKDDSLELQFITLNRFEVKVTTSQSCNGGTWEPWSEYKVIPVPARDQMLTISVQYKDWDGRVGHCYRQSILHDGSGPNILFTRYPAASLEEGATADLTADVTDALGSVASVTCSMNGLQKPCFAGRNEVSISQLPAGDYVFTVNATDDMGNSSQKSVSWKVVNATRRLTQDIRVNNYKKVDILIVIDNSGSMEYEQRNMGQRTGNLLSVIRGLDYQIAVTTTDPRNITLGDGRFLPISGSGGRYILDTSTDEVTAQKRLSATLQRSEQGSGSEQGIRVTRRVIDRYVSNENNARAFFREGAQFAVVVISDEDESDNTEKNDPQNLVNAVHSTFNGQKMFSFHSIITKPGDTACRSTNGYAYGDRYDVMSRLTGGVIGSVCEADYAAQVTGIAQGVRNLLKTLTLQCQPVAGKPLTITRGGVTVTPSYVLDGLNLKFDQELEPGDYKIDYQCLR